MQGKSLNITQHKLQVLNDLFPEVFTEGKIDFDRLKRVLGDGSLAQGEQYELTWAGKSNARKEIQQQTTATLIPDIKSSILFNDAQNVFIEGENLEVLKVIQKSYFGKIKLIYIDPPYNTGNDSFVYPDNYSEKKEEYSKRTGISDKSGYLNKFDLWKKHSKENGQFHSIWLSMMYSRLYLSRNLLKDDGLILISIDDNEADNLKLLCDEIFGHENFIGKFVWVNRTTPNDAKMKFATDHEYIIAYAKNKNLTEFKGNKKDLTSYKNPDNDPKGDWIADNPTAASGNENYKFAIVNPYTNEKHYPPKGRYWAFAPRRVEEWTLNGKLVFPKVKGKNFVLKKYKTELRSNLKPISSIIQGILTSHGTKELKLIFNDGSPFKYPKPSKLLKLLIEQTTSNNDIILDFFAGSGTTAHATIAANASDAGNRKYICIQMPETYSSEDNDLNKKYKYVSDVTKLRIKKVIELYSKEKPDINKEILTLKCFKLGKTNFKIWDHNIKDRKEILNQLAELKEQTILKKEEDLIYELMLKQGILLTEKPVLLNFKNMNYYFIENFRMVFIFDSFTQELSNYLLNKVKPDTIICLDKVFENNDKLKTNIGLKLSENNVTLKTI